MGAKTTAARLARRPTVKHCTGGCLRICKASWPELFSKGQDKSRLCRGFFTLSFPFYILPTFAICSSVKVLFFPLPLLPSFLPPPVRSEALHVSVRALRKAEQPLTNIQLSETTSALWALQSLVCFVLFFRLTL